MDKKIMKGGHALCHAAVKAGCRFFAGYPITPQNEIPEMMSVLMPENDGIFIQAEAELSAINMIFGASSVGERCMTSSSSPGISLKQEGISYIAAAELPCVIVNMARGGPGLGNIRASQADYFQATKGGGHGDYRQIVLAPCNIQELYDLTMDAFDYADLFRNPVMILGDGIISQMAEPVELKPYKQRFRLPKKDWALGISKGREPNVIKTLLLNPPDLLIEHNKKLSKKYEKIEKELCLYEEYKTDDASVLIVAFGTSARIAKESVDQLRKDNIKAGLIRPITLWPFPKAILKKHSDKDMIVIEMNNGQMIEDVRLAVRCRNNVTHFGKGGGWYPDTRQINEHIKSYIKR